MRVLISTILLLVSAIHLRAESVPFAQVVKPSLVFRADSDPARRSFRQVLKVFLRLDNIRDGEVSWVANSVTGIQAELFDAEGAPVPRSPAAASISSNYRPFQLPYGSRLDWLISHGGVSLMADATDKFALVVGGQGWLIPVEAVGSYSLRIRLYGFPWRSNTPRAELKKPELLLELPPAKIEITP